MHIVYKGFTIFVEMKVMEGTLSDLQAFMLQRWQNAGATCMLGVWDAEQKAFVFFSNPPDWKYFIGKVKPHVQNMGITQIGFNARYTMLQEMLDSLYAKYAD